MPQCLIPTGSVQRERTALQTGRVARKRQQRTSMQSVRSVDGVFRRGPHAGAPPVDVIDLSGLLLIEHLVRTVTPRSPRIPIPISFNRAHATCHRRAKKLRQRCMDDVKVWLSALPLVRPCPQLFFSVRVTVRIATLLSINASIALPMLRPEEAA